LRIEREWIREIKVIVLEEKMEKFGEEMDDGLKNME
jgi:hypothetical protein